MLGVLALPAFAQSAAPANSPELAVASTAATTAPAREPGTSVASPTPDNAAVRAPSPQQRPKIALVLGGGGARGYAHIGVLEWLDEHRIPIDYIVGTSIGGLVGGSYAAGTSPKEMRKLINGINWADVFKQDGPYPLLSFRRKEDARDYQVDLTLGLKGGLSIPAGLFPAQPVNLLLDKVTLPYAEIRSFDELPIPFRCVSGDIVTGDRVVFKDGSLPEAMRATMAIPGVFTPVRRNGQILVDGMIVDNVPADVARDEFKPDIIIAVDVGTPLASVEELGSALAISGQALSVMIVNNTRLQLRDANLVLSPDLDKSYTTSSFTKVNEIADIGYKTAEAHKAELEKLALDDAAWSSFVAARDARRRTKNVVPEFVDVKGTTAEAVRIVQDGFKPYLGKPLDLETLDATLTRIMGTGRYETVTYGVVERDGKDGLQVLITEKAYAPPFVRFGLDLANQQVAGADINLTARVTFLDVLAYGDEVRVDAGLGFNSYVGTEYYRRLGRSKVFVAPFISVDKLTTDIFNTAGEDVARYGLRTFTAGADLGVQINRFSEFRAGYQFRDIDASVQIGDPLLPSVSGSVNLIRGRYQLDRSSSAQFNHDGLRFAADYVHFFDSEAISSDADRGEARVSYFKPLSEKNVVGIRAAGGTGFNSDVSAVYQFTIGGPYLMSAYALNEFRGRNYFYVSPTYLRKIGSLPDFIGGDVFVSAAYEAGAAYNSWSVRDTKNDGALGLLMETKLGGLGIGGAVGENGRARIFFTFGSVLR
jgi:NTE family protein